MNKSFEALKLGYIIFDVNGKKFATYNNGLNYSNSLSGNVSFKGFNIKQMRWELFLIKVTFEPVDIDLELSRCRKYYIKYMSTAKS